MNGQPERTRDSSNDRALMAFSINAVSTMLGINVPACSIHARLLLSGSIIILNSYTVK